MQAEIWRYRERAKEEEKKMQPSCMHHLSLHWLRVACNFLLLLCLVCSHDNNTSSNSNNIYCSSNSNKTASKVNSNGK